ncbi:glycosyltransferase [Conexibacter sp. DBS9H8]|uniref:glycosyltransferase n=1 Tax=Conexibacter sp. DBS9H8 TaxID=2937801 RepID=UPI00200D085D|nr:glycosyltransferase [Conexibacter sp. DBS9H8]
MRSGFVILSSDEADALEVALAAALAEGFDRRLVVDNASRDQTAAVADRHGCERLALPRRVPYTEAMNAGLSALLDGPDPPELIALLQADTFVTPGFLAATRAVLTARPEVGSVAPKLIRTTGPAPGDQLELLDAAGMTFDRRRKNRLVGHGRPAGSFARAGEIFGADGAAAVWRADALRDCAVEGRVFDENMPGWGCDADLAWRAQRFGWRAWYVPEAVVFHIRTYSPTTRAQARPEDRATQFRNRLLMIVKNDRPAELLRDLPWLIGYELLALGYALLVERELLGGYRQFAARLAEARRQRALIQARSVRAKVPFGLVPPP